MRGIRPSGFFQANRHVRRHAGASVQNSRKGVARDAKSPCRVSNTEAERIQAGVFNRVAGVSGFFMRIVILLCYPREPPAGSTTALIDPAERGMRGSAP